MQSGCKADIHGKGHAGWAGNHAVARAAREAGRNTSCAGREAGEAERGGQADRADGRESARRGDRQTHRQAGRQAGSEDG